MARPTDEIGDQITTLGDKCMDYLIGNPEELSRFMTHSGISPDALRMHFGDRDIALGAIDYFARNESALLAMCANAGITAETFMRAWQRLNPEL